jgi:transportin-1
MSTTISIPPPPYGQVLSLVSALSQTENHGLHVQAIQARDQALISGPDSYGNLCLQLAYLTVGSDQPDHLMSRIEKSEMHIWQATDGNTASRIQANPAMWIPFGQMAGLILKNALLRPPIQPSTGRPISLETGVAEHVKETLLYGLSLAHSELRNVISSVIADCSVSADGVQPYLHTSQWPKLMPTLIQNLEPNANPNALKGSLSTIRKMMEDDPEEIPTASLDMVVYLLLQHFNSPDENSRLESLQSLVACLAYGLVPSSLVLHFSAYLDGLSRLATDPSAAVRKWVCRSINTLLEHHTQYIEPQLESICQFMLQSTTQQQQHHQHQDDNIEVATEACEFWLIFASLHENLMTSSMLETVERILTHLVPTLLNNMVYSREQQIDLVAQNEIDDQEEPDPSQAMKPVFHRTKSKHDGSRDDHKGEKNDGSDGMDGNNNRDDDDDGDDDEEDDFDDDDNEWNLRKYAGASLDSLSDLYGAGPILPPLLPSLQHGLASSDPWIQEASILALGAIADGCREEMYAHMSQLYPYLMNLLLKPESPENLPQVKCISAWTSSRYAGWAVNEVQEGSQGHLLAQTTEVYLKRLHDKNRKVQIACGSALGVLMEAAGDLMVPYLHQIYIELVSAMSRFQGRSLVIVLDTVGIMAEYCGPATGENNLPGIYVPPLMVMWNTLLRQDPSNRMLLPLMETLANVALVCGMNYQPFALETFENAMGIIEQVQLALATTEDPSDEEADPIICATDLLDGLCEGLGPSFCTLVLSSSRFGQHFTSVLHALCVHHVVGIRVSAFALLGDLARKAPTMIEAALPQLIQDAIGNLEPSFLEDEMHSSLCNNVVWSIGEICVQCGDHSGALEPYAATLMQQLIALLMGNGTDRITSIPGLAENAAACVGRLANVNPMFVAPELSRFLLGWCDGLARISDLRERRDAFNGLCNALYANPQVIQSMGVPAPDVISSILFSITSWHIPSDISDDTQDLLSGEGGFQPFPPTEAAIGLRLAQLIKDIRSSVGEESWKIVTGRLPVNVRRLFREVYQL